MLWPARRVASRVAILAHRSANAWDPAGTAKWENQTEQTMTYQADQFGLYLALAVHSNVPVDFLDEDALLNATVLAQYDAIFVTEPNVPAAAIAQLGAYATKGGGTLVLSAGAAQFDEYNTSDGTLGKLSGSMTTTLRRRVLPEVRQVRPSSSTQITTVQTTDNQCPAAAAAAAAAASAAEFAAEFAAAEFVAEFAAAWCDAGTRPIPTAIRR